MASLESPQSVKDAYKGFLDEVFTELSLLLLMYSGQRSYAEQWELRKKYLEGGTRAASPGYSWHPYGRGVDVIPVFYDGKPNWELPSSVWVKIAAIGQRWGLKSGIMYGDPGHFESSQGLSLAQYREVFPGWEVYAALEKKMNGMTKWVKQVLYFGIGGMLIYGIFTYLNRPDDRP